MKKLRYKRNHFTHNERKGMIESLETLPHLFTMSSSLYVDLEMETYNIRIASKIQKQLRQTLYQYLLDNDLPTHHYTLNLGAPMRPTNSKTHIEILMTAPTLIEGDLASNECISRTILDMVADEFRNRKTQL